VRIIRVGNAGCGWIPDARVSVLGLQSVEEEVLELGRVLHTRWWRVS
jgi:hypothetical protein